jgi:aspartate aminotransferase
MTAGDLDFPSPPHAVEAAVTAARAGDTRYTDVGGTQALKAAVAEHFRRQNGLAFDPSEIIVTTGSSQAIANAFAVTMQPGDEVVIPNPSWATYAGQAALAGGSPVFVSCAQNNGFKLRPDDLAGVLGARTRWVVINNPVNPTGALYTEAELAALCAVLRRHPDVWILADNLYEHLVFDGRKAATLLEVAPDLRDRTITISGVAKSYSMMGWRIGYAAGPAGLIADMTRVQYLTTSCPSSISQAAAVAALLGPQDLLVERAGILQAKRDLLVGVINDGGGLACVPPEATFYLCISCSSLVGRRRPDGRAIDTGGDVSDYLLETAGVAVLPGEAYGLPCYVRATFAVPIEDLHRAARLIGEACHALLA